VRAAGGVIAGGHSVIDREPKYGLAVVGRAHPDRLLRKAGAQPGDVLVLTKPLGTGLVTTALKRGLASAEQVAAATATMMTLNLVAGRAAVDVGARAATDVTGFGLVGHALEMADQGGVGLRIAWPTLPRLPGALGHAAAGCVPGGLSRNQAAFAPRVAGLANLPAEWAALLFDPQTSGGLLVALPAEAVAAFAAELAAAGVAGTIIGSVIAGTGLHLVASGHSILGGAT
jgi:selenide,water dikinase